MDTLDQLDAALRRRVTATLNSRPSAAGALASGGASGGATSGSSGGVVGLDPGAMGLTAHEVWWKCRSVCPT